MGGSDHEQEGGDPPCWAHLFDDREEQTADPGDGTWADNGGAAGTESLSGRGSEEERPPGEAGAVELWLWGEYY